LLTIPEGEAAKAIPLGLVLPLLPHRQLGGGLGFHGWKGKAERELHVSAARSKRPLGASSGFHRSPRRRRRARMFDMVKSSMRIPRSTSCQVTGVDTVASSVGRRE